ncbi:MAG: nitroreductase family protein [Dehalococcoidia bacterium]|nr:nitroreductase family protein [Dehalococcoidia bacterium]
MPELLPALADRRARRAFDPRPVAPAEVELLYRAVSVAPSHGNSQATRLLVAEAPATRDALIAALNEGNRGWAAAAPLLVAVASITTHESNPRNRDGSEREMWAFNSGIATGNLLAQATEMGIVAHPMAGFDEPAVRAVFELPTEVRVLVVVAAGYPGAAESLPEDLRGREDAPQLRLPVEILVAHDRWTAENATTFREYRERGGASR